MEINPLFYGLSNRIQLVELGGNSIGILKVIKSRIILKDAAKIIESAKQIKARNADLEVALVCNRNICSKSIALLENEGIAVQYVDADIEI